MLLQNPHHPDPHDPGPRHRAPRPPRGRRTARRGLALLVALLLATAGASYVQALTYPGNADWQVRSVDWVRAHGGSGLVNTVENWWYAHNAPTGHAPAPGSLPTAAATAGGASGTGGGPSVPPGPAAPAPLPLLSGTPALPGEAQWVPSPQRTGGAPVMMTGYFRPDPAYPSQVVGVAWMDQSRLRTHLIAGTREPGGGGWPEQAQVPPDMRSTLVAAFNSGWKMKDISGGFYADGRTAVPLTNGAASLVIDTGGRVTVGQWGRDVSMGPRVAAVRQNLALVVENGRPVSGLSDNSSGAWGNAKNQFQYTWRSGLGTDRSGNLIYVAGDKLTLSGLAQAMTAAGIQRGMELDIHTAMVTFNTFHTFHRAAGAPSGLVGTKLLPDMSQSAIRYLAPDQRDFLAVTLRQPGAAGAASAR